MYALSSMKSASKKQIEDWNFIFRIWCVLTWKRNEINKTLFVCACEQTFDRSNVTFYFIHFEIYSNYFSLKFKHFFSLRLFFDVN